MYLMLTVAAIRRKIIIDNLLELLTNISSCGINVLKPHLPWMFVKKIEDHVHPRCARTRTNLCGIINGNFLPNAATMDINGLLANNSCDRFGSEIQTAALDVSSLGLYPTLQGKILYWCSFHVC